MIAVVDYGMGNVKSISNALNYLGIVAEITSDYDVLSQSSHIILPGVGAFGDAMTNLKDRGLVEKLEELVLRKRKPFLGICLGLQLLAKNSDEHGKHQGLGWMDAEVVKLQPGSDRLKIPHVGWNNIIPTVKHPLFNNLKKDQLCFYFVHSYQINCHDSSNVAAVCEYGSQFTAAVQKDNIFATQFHPEKSQDNGIQMLSNFASWSP